MHIVNSVLGDASGGRWRVVCDYSRLLLARGHRVRMLLNRRHRPDPAGIPPGATVEFVDSRGHYDLPAAWRLRRRLAEATPDLAIAHCSRSVALLGRALAGRAPVLAVSHSPKVRRLLRADACLALTPAIAASIAAERPDKRCFVVPNMIPLASRQAPPRSVHRPPVLGAMGRFDPVKGFDVFIDALGALDRQGYRFTARLAGDGSERKALRRRVAALGLSDRVSFPGWTDDPDAFLAGVDVFCVPARSDAFGLTPLEAARAGVPLVLSRASGHREMFAEEREALFAETGDIEATARQLARLAESPELAERLRQAAFAQLLDNYSTEAVSDRLIDIIENKII